MNKINNFKKAKGLNKYQQAGLQKLYSIMRDSGMNHEDALRETVALVIEVMSLPVRKPKAP